MRERERERQRERERERKRERDRQKEKINRDRHRQRIRCRGRTYHTSYLVHCCVNGYNSMKEIGTFFLYNKFWNINYFDKTKLYQNFISNYNSSCRWMIIDKNIKPPSKLSIFN